MLKTEVAMAAERGSDEGRWTLDSARELYDLPFNDLLYRFGGEEFVVLMRCEDEPDAAHAFERFRHNTAHYAFPQVGRITVSIGFTQIRGGDSPAAAFERADKAVYHAKGAGRNQLQSYAALVAQGTMVEPSHLSDVELF